MYLDNEVREIHTYKNWNQAKQVNFIDKKVRQFFTSVKRHKLSIEEKEEKMVSWKNYKKLTL